MTTNTTETAWPEGVIARYLTVGGATVGIRYADGDLTVDCTGCEKRVERVDVGAYYDDTPEQVTEKVTERLPARRETAQSHAERCRAMPRPTTD